MSKIHIFKILDNPDFNEALKGCTTWYV